MSGTRREAAVQAFAGVAQEPGSPKPDPILIANDVVRAFGGLTAVDVSHVEIQRGAITALIGPNGAGKTTFFNLLTGFDRADSGSWTFNEQNAAKLPPYRLARRGMVRTFQLTKALSRMTVLEHAFGGDKSNRRTTWGSSASVPVVKAGAAGNKAVHGDSGAVQPGRESSRFRWVTVRWAAQTAGDGPRTHGEPNSVDA